MSRRTERNRLLAAGLFAGLTDEQWRTPSLCAGWSGRRVAAHLLMPVELSTGGLLLRLVRERGSLDWTVDKVSRVWAERPTEQTVATLRGRAAARLAPPGLGPLGPVTDTCVHLRDARLPDVRQGPFRVRAEGATRRPGVAR